MFIKIAVSSKQPQEKQSALVGKVQKVATLMDCHTGQKYIDISFVNFTTWTITCNMTELYLTRN